MTAHKVKQTHTVVSQAKKAAPKALRASRAIQAIQAVQEVKEVEQANSRGRIIILLQRFKSQIFLLYSYIIQSNYSTISIAYIVIKWLWSNRHLIVGQCCIKSGIFGGVGISLGIRVQRFYQRLHIFFVYLSCSLYTFILHTSLN